MERCDVAERELIAARNEGCQLTESMIANILKGGNQHDQQCPLCTALSSEVRTSGAREVPTATSRSYLTSTHVPHLFTAKFHSASVEITDLLHTAISVLHHYFLTLPTHHVINATCSHHVSLAPSSYLASSFAYFKNGLPLFHLPISCPQ